MIKEEMREYFINLFSTLKRWKCTSVIFKSTCKNLESHCREKNSIGVCISY